MAFGLSFGMNKSKGSSNTNVTKAETTNQTETGTKATTGTTTTTGSTTGTSNTQTQQSQTGATTNQTTGQTSQQATQFSDSVLAGIEGLIGQLMGSAGARPAIAEMGQFDAETFVNQGMAAAEARQNTALDEALNGMYDSVGGRAASNSMVALLENRTRGDAAANLAGIEANLNQQAQGILRDNMLGNNQVRATDNQFLTAVLDSLKGGRTAGTGTTSESQVGTSAQQATGSSATQTAEQTAQTQVQTLLEILNNVMSGTSTMVGTESTKTKGKNIGGGAGISL